MATTMTLLGSSKTVEKDLDLVILTSNTLFQRVEASLYLLHLLTLQLNNGLAIKADPTVHVEDLMLLFVDGSVTGGKNQCLELEHCKYTVSKWTM